MLDERRINVSELNDDELVAALKRHGLNMTPYEARRIAQMLGRDPTLCEIHIFNVEWSEHCSYKSSKATLQEFLPTSAPNVIQGPEEDAGIIELCRINGRRWGLVIAHESHNHPSQVLPVEGAATGIGGIVRDVDCMGATVIGTADPLRFGDPYGKHKDRTRWIAGGVVDGIWQYGNALGVPVLAGDVVFSDSFDDNCLVNVVAIGIVPEDEIVHSAVPPEAADEPYDIIVVGKPTDDSGFGGSAFASKILDEEEREEDRAAVQVPDPFLKNVLLMHKANEDVRRRAKELGITIGIKDFGGGGFACGTSEIGAAGGFGMEINLDDVHQSLEGLLPEVICCAETQERYVLAVPQRFTEEVLRIYNEDWDLPNIYQGACARVVGRAMPDQTYRLIHKGVTVCEAPIKAVTSGISYEREARPRQVHFSEPDFPMPEDLGAVLLQVLADPNVASKEHIYRFYDTEIQGNAVIRAGEADAGVIAPFEDQKVGVALSVDGNPFYGAISPYWGGATAVAEAMRNVAAVGAVPSGLTDCLNFGNPENPEAFWEFREAVRGLADAARNIHLKGYGDSPVPVVSGNVSFYNESATGSAVYPSPIICCLGILEDFSKAVTLQLRSPGNVLYLIGKRYDELGGSQYYRSIADSLGANVPIVRWEDEQAGIYTVIDAIEAGLVRSCHDISNGGLIVTVAEMMMGGWGTGTLGARIDIAPACNGLRPDKALFSESSGFVVEVQPDKADAFEQLARATGAWCIRIGATTEEPALAVTSGDEQLLRCTLPDMKEAWTTSLPDALR